MKDDFTSDHPLPLLLSGHADEHEERGTLLLLNASILLLVASLVAMAIILLWGNPVKVFADVTASLTNISALQPGTDQSTPTIPSAPTAQSTADAQAIQSTADAQALPPTASGAPTRNEIAAASEPADQSQTEISEPTSEALFKQFQAWAAERAQVGPAQPVQDAPARVVQDAPAPVAKNAGAPVQPTQKHRGVRQVQDARAESRPVQNPRPKVRREQNAQVQVSPVTDARAQGQAVQNAQAPSFLQSLGGHN
jgi:cytoskeletal protein RodZ